MRTPSPRQLAGLAAALAVFVAAWALLDVPPLSVMREWSARLGPWFPPAFWLLYIALTQLPIPRTILTVSAGILFGTRAGIALAITATTASAVLSLVLVRGLLREWVEPRLTHPSVERINERLEQRGWLAVASLRMIAAVPFSVLNYTAALTRVGVVPFAVATFVGSLPGTVITVLFGDALTGHADPRVIVAGVVLALGGVAGLVLDARLPTRNPSARRAEVKAGR